MSVLSKITLGEVYSLLTIIEDAGQDEKTTLKLVKCLCECGNEITVKFTYLKRGRINSCGCATRKVNADRLRSHGMRWTPAYSSWCAMKARCLNTNNPNYAAYGAVGITICDRWMKFEAFFEDMGERPAGTSLNRINGAMIYSKETCEWADDTTQSRDQKTQTRNNTGIRGVFINKKGTYLASISIDKKKVYLGSFSDFFEACCCRKAAELLHWPGHRR